MDAAQPARLSERVLTGSAAAGCRVCGAPWGTLPPAAIAVLDGALLGRCTHCGTRRGVGGAGEPDPPPPEDRIAGLVAPSVEPAELEATDREVRAALAGALRFVGSARLNAYLGRLVQQAARSMDTALTRGRVFLFDDPALRTLALPSGSLVISVGMLASLEDEAELVFVLAHELAHVGAGDVARLVPLGLRAVARSGRCRGREAWLEAAVDLMRIGHGAEQEHRADLAALRVLVELGYDGQAAARWLTRVGRQIEASAPELAEYVIAHPLPAQRLRRLEREYGAELLHGTGGRVDREVFRRAAGRAVLAAELAPVPSGEGIAAVAGEAVARPWRPTRLVWTGLGILLLAAVLLLLGLALSR